MYCVPNLWRIRRTSLGTSKSRRMGLPLMAHGKNGDLTMAHWDSRGMSYLYLSIASKTIHLGG